MRKAGACPNCGLPFQNVGPSKSAAKLGNAPEGLHVTDGESWTLDAQPTAFFGPWIFAVGWLLAAILLWRGERIAPNPIDIVFKTFFTLSVSLLFTKAFFQTWGRYAMFGTPTSVTLLSGIGTVGWRRDFGLKSLRQIRLRTISRKGQKYQTIAIVADRTLCFGEDLTDEQRRYIALFLLHKQSG
jgi:hypothetical protein